MTGDAEMTACAANNATGVTSWGMETFAERQLINILLLFIGKSTDTQTTFGNGNMNGNTNKPAGSDSNGVLPTGTMDDKGLFWGSDTDNLGVKVFGIEHWWGNLWRRVVGYFNDNGVYKVKLTKSRYDGTSVSDYNTTGVGYIAYSSLTPSEGYIRAMDVSQWGLVAKSAGSGASTAAYYCDHQWVNNSQLNMALFGGRCADGLHCGAFACHLYDTVGHHYWNFGASPSLHPSIPA